jgi:excisionase family DNA binding protein
MDTLTTREAARLLDVSDQTIRRYIASGTIPSVRLQDGAWNRIDRAKLEEYARSRGITLDWSKLDNRE